MTIPEAAELVIQAGAMGKGGDVFVLDMGEPVKIYELAKRLINLSGMEVKDDENPDGDIEIIFTGLRPGEKLHEEMITELDSENAYEFNNYYMILPSKINGSGHLNYSQELNYIGKVKSGFCYNSKNNEEFLNVHELKSMINYI